MGSGLLQPRALCNPLPVTYRTVLSRQAVQRSSRAVGSGDPSPATWTGTGRGGAGPAGRGGAVTRSRARAGERASGRALCGSGGAEAAAPLGSARLGSARLRSGCSGSRAGSAGRDPADRTTSPSSLPAGPRFPEGTRSQEERSQLSQAGRRNMECAVPLTEHNLMNCTDRSSETSS